MLKEVLRLHNNFFLSLNSKSFNRECSFPQTIFCCSERMRQQQVCVHYEILCVSAWFLSSSFFAQELILFWGIRIVSNSISFDMCVLSFGMLNGWQQNYFFIFSAIVIKFVATICFLKDCILWIFLENI